MTVPYSASQRLSTCSCISATLHSDIRSSTASDSACFADLQHTHA